MFVALSIENVRGVTVCEAETGGRQTQIASVRRMRLITLQTVNNIDQLSANGTPLMRTMLRSGRVITGSETRTLRASGAKIINSASCFTRPDAV